MIKNIFFSLILLCLIVKTNVYAQQGKVDSSFNTFDDGLIGDGFDSPVRTLSLQDDQNLIVGGEYLNLNGNPAPYLTRLKPDGTVDESFNIGTGFNGKIYASYVQPDGKIIVGGSFTSFKGISCGRLIRLNADGSYDASFNTSIAATGIIYAISPQSDGKIIIVGSFIKYNGSTVNKIARILPSGDLDTSFTTGSGSLLNIMNASVLADGKILLIGNFISFNGFPASKIVRLNSDGHVDTDFNSGTGFDDDVSAMTVQQDGKIILGGKFTNYNGIAANRIIRINCDGSVDISFLSGAGFSNGAVLTIKANNSGSIMVGGSFTGNYNGGDVNRVCLLNSSGVLSTDIDFGSGPATASVFALENDSEGSWYIGGSFSVFDGLNQGKLAKINTEGEYDTGYLSAGVGFDNSVFKVLPLENKKTMVFGNFKKFNGASIYRIACLLEDGTLDTGFNTQQAGANNLIKNAIIQLDGKIICGGNFTKYNETLINRIVRISPDGTVDNTFSVGTGLDNQVNALAIQSDNKILAGGKFTLYNGVPVGRLIRLLPNGLPDMTFNVGLGVDANVETILVQPDHKILVGGQFSTFNGQLISRLVRLNADGSIDATFNVGSGFDKYIYTMALQSDGKIIVGGNFVNYNGTIQKRIVRLNPDGSLDPSFQSGSAGFSKGDVRSILIQPDGRIIVGGTFSGTYKNSISMRLIRLLKSGDFDPSFDARLNNKLYTMGFTANHRLMIGGDFNSISGISKHRVARLKLCLDYTFWDGFNWSNGFPSGGKEIAFKENYSSLTTSNVCSCSIDEGKVVTLLSDNTLEIEFSYFGQGTLVLEDSANLYQSDDDMINTGIISLKRKTSPILRYDYTCWSSPVDFQKLVDVSPNTLSDKYYSYNCLIKNWQLENPSTVMIPGKGYIIRGPQYFSITTPEVYEAIFKGIPNNGKIEAELGNDCYRSLVGNPYPCTLDADAFLKKNSAKIRGTLYFWTHNTPVTNLKYNTDDYAVYNLLGGTGTRGAMSTGINESIPDKTIASGQAFFVISKGIGAVEFYDNMRLNYKSSTFFKPGSRQKTKEADVERSRIWLNLKNESGIFKQILVGYIEGATDFYDEEFDAESLSGNKFADFYSIIEQKKLVIQGRSLPFDESDSIPVGYTTAVEGNLNITIDHADGLFTSPRDFFIEDKELKIIHNLKNGPYSFNTVPGAFNDRFVLRFADSTLKTQNFEDQSDQILVSVNKQNIFFDSTKNDIKNIVIFDISGKQIYSKNDIKNGKFSIQNFPAKNQVLLIKTTLENGYNKTYKVIF